jgi:hypothetical protein
VLDAEWTKRKSDELERKRVEEEKMKEEMKAKQADAEKN